MSFSLHLSLTAAEHYTHWKTLTALLTSWITLTSLFEYLWGQHAGSIGRTVMFFLDLFALAEMHGLVLVRKSEDMFSSVTGHVAASEVILIPLQRYYCL